MLIRMKMMTYTSDNIEDYLDVFQYGTRNSG